MMKLTALSIALIAALGVTSGCSTQTSKQSLMAAPITADAEAQYALGRFYQGQQRYELAIEAYRKALMASPTHVSAHNGLGASLLLVGQNTQAIEQFKTGLIHQPRSAALWNNLGYAYLLSGENKLAQIALKQALDLDPADTKTSTNLAMAQEQPAQPAATAPAGLVLASTMQVPAHVQAKTELPAAQAQAEPVKAEMAPTVVVSSPVYVAPEAPVIAAMAQPATVPAQLAPAAVQVVEVAPRVYELSMPETTVTSTQVAFTSLAMLPVKTSNVTTISVPLRNEMPETAPVATASADKAQTAQSSLTQSNLAQSQAQPAALSHDTFALEVRNGNGVRRMAWRTAQFLVLQGYTTRRLTNQPGFNVAITRIFYLPGYLVEAERLLPHLPQNTTLTESLDLRQGTHVRVVLGRDMVQRQAELEREITPIQVASLTR